MHTLTDIPAFPVRCLRQSCLVSLCLARCPESSFTKTHRKMLPPNLPPRRESPSPSANPSSDSDDAIRLTDDDAASSRLYVSRLFFHCPLHLTILHAVQQRRLGISKTHSRLCYTKHQCHSLADSDCKVVSELESHL